MAKGVLCFIFGICYEDEWFTENANETRSANAMSNANDAPSLSLYPNPVCNMLNIELSGSLIENVHLFDLQGRIVGSSMSINDVLATVDVNDIPSGVYFVQVISQDGKIFHQRIIKN